MDDLVARATADGMSCLALTDTNALYGAVDFSRACLKAGIKPMLGMTITAALSPMGGDSPSQLVLLAKGREGYQSLCQLSSMLQGSQDREVRLARGVGWQELQACSSGLICLGGGRRGWVMRQLAQGNHRSAQRIAGRLAGIYGESNTFLSLELHKAQDRELGRELAALGNRLGLPLVAVQPVYCMEARDASKLRLLAAIAANCRLDSVEPEWLPDDGDAQVDLHWQSPAQIARRFDSFPDLVPRASELAARCQPALPDGRPVWPAVQLPDGQTPAQALELLARTGLRERYGEDAPPEIGRRLQRELDAIASHGYASLFLVVADLVRFARQADIPVSTRGSVANSLVAYCSRITNVDPIAHDLLFERFLNPARTDPPDIDLDLCSRRREEVLIYVRETYGADRMAVVGAINTLQLRSAVRETAKAYGLDDEQAECLVRLLPRRYHPDPRRRSRPSPEELLKEVDDPTHAQILRAALELAGQPHHLSLHAGAVTLTPGSLSRWIPVQWTPKGFLATQYDHQGVEHIGLPKIDLLGIRALTVLAEAVELVRLHHRAAFRLEDISLDDRPTADLIARGETIGVFQCESSGAQRTLRQLMARTVKDLAVANAFFKPGPATGGMAASFVRRYRGEERVAFLDPSLEPILSPTKGVLIFQEQILRVAVEVAGLSWEQANHLRRGMSRFRREEMDAIQKAFVEGCQRPSPNGPGMDAERAAALWGQVGAFAGYGFNQGHATAYADVSFRSAYLKTHWPAAFLAARLANRGGFHHPAIYMAEATRLGAQVHPPHVNHSGIRFTLSWESEPGGEPVPHLWMGLGSVRDLRRASISRILSERKKGRFGSLRDLLIRVPLRYKEQCHLVQCGGLDGLGESRMALLAEVDEIERAGSPRQMALDFGRPSVPAEEPAQRLAWERHLLGQPVSTHPLALVGAQPPDTVPISELPRYGGRQVRVAGVRLPGWTGGKGFFLGDQEAFVVARLADGEQEPQTWMPVLLHGRWLSDQWGGGWFRVDATRMVGQSLPR